MNLPLDLPASTLPFVFVPPQTGGLVVDDSGWISKMGGGANQPIGQPTPTIRVSTNQIDPLWLVLGVLVLLLVMRK